MTMIPIAKSVSASVSFISFAVADKERISLKKDVQLWPEMLALLPSLSFLILG